MADLVKRDCFAFRSKINENTNIEKMKCDALKELYCEEKGKCSFYQTKKQLEEKRAKLREAKKE